MKPQRAPFLPVSSDILDDKLERLAQEKGVASMVMPTPEPSRAGHTAQGPQPAPAKPEATKPPVSADMATPRSDMQPVNLELPAYVKTDLKIRAARTNTSVRHIIMTALKAYGIEINEADMIEDGRRLRT